ncbi:uncharacterized protein LOC132706075 [Cylas formicarius]|uniref:uncharacterized protein LOC132706075 n=1 Tax=Cylas formicarius TaxID=197179 RepID=UPI002958AA4D|nr:uncharacterized protein LOC132706075 [Cylas formicarius]
MGTTAKDLLNAPLPSEILKGSNLSTEASRKYIQNMLQQHLPSTDIKYLRNDLQWQFILEQHSLRKKSARRPKKTFLTRQQRKEANLLKLPREGWSYKSLGIIRNMWKDYMRQNLDFIKKAPSPVDPDWNSFSLVVAKSELIGAEIKVIRSKVPSLIGMSGTVVLETKLSFQIVTPQSKLKTILKEMSVFEVILDNLRFVFFGKHLATRPNERSVKKIKLQMIPDL